MTVATGDTEDTQVEVEAGCHTGIYRYKSRGLYQPVYSTYGPLSRRVEIDHVAVLFGKVNGVATSVVNVFFKIIY